LSSPRIVVVSAEHPSYKAERKRDGFTPLDSTPLTRDLQDPKKMVNATPDNANPTIHSSTRSNARRVRVADLDLSADDDLAWDRLGHQLEHEANALELARSNANASLQADHRSPRDEIDEDEIFGPFLISHLSSGGGVVAHAVSNSDWDDTDEIQRPLQT
jgi:hypothetical protein